MNKLILSLISLVLALGAISAGYAITYTTNAFGYSNNTSSVTLDMTTYVDHYGDYPNNSYASYYYNGAYYYYPTYTANYYVVPATSYVTYPVAYYNSYVPTYYTYTYVAPVNYTYYNSNGWYYS